MSCPQQPPASFSRARLTRPIGGFNYVSAAAMPDCEASPCEVTLSARLWYFNTEDRIIYLLERLLLLLASRCRGGRASSRGCSVISVNTGKNRARKVTFPTGHCSAVQ